MWSTNTTRAHVDMQMSRNRTWSTVVATFVRFEYMQLDALGARIKYNRNSTIEKLFPHTFGAEYAITIVKTPYNT